MGAALAIQRSLAELTRKNEGSGKPAMAARIAIAFTARRAEHPNTQARAREDVMFGCSDVCARPHATF